MVTHYKDILEIVIPRLDTRLIHGLSRRSTEYVYTLASSLLHSSTINHILIYRNTARLITFDHGSWREAPRQCLFLSPKLHDFHQLATVSRVCVLETAFCLSSSLHWDRGLGVSYLAYRIISCFGGLRHGLEICSGFRRWWNSAQP